MTGAVEEFDALYGIAVTRLSWPADEALGRDHDLRRTRLAGNLVTATEGRRYTEAFVVDPYPDAPPGESQPAVVRTVSDAAVVHLHTLQSGRLAWLTSGGTTTPEVHVEAQPPDPADPVRTLAVAAQAAGRRAVRGDLSDRPGALRRPAQPPVRMLTSGVSCPSVTFRS